MAAIELQLAAEAFPADGKANQAVAPRIPSSKHSANFPAAALPSGRGLPFLKQIFSFLLRVLKLSQVSVLRYLAVITTLQAVNGLLVIPAIKYLFGLALENSNLGNVTDRTYTALLAHPVSVLLLVAIAVLALGAVSVQFVALIVMVNRQQSGQSPNLRAVCRETASCLRRMLSYPSPLMMAYFFLALPLGGLGLSSVLIQGVGIPPFITREYLKAPLSTALYLLMIGAIIYANLRLVLTLPLLAVGPKKPLAALGASLKATRRNSLRYLLLIGIPLGASALCASLLVEALVWISDLATGLLSEQDSALVATLCIGVGHTLGFLLIGAATVMAIQVVVALGREHLQLPVTLQERSQRHRRAQSRALKAVAGTAVTALVLSGSLAASPALGQTATGAGEAKILAHRGYSAGGVENTLAALDAAAAHQADIVEADFQETADGHFVASHDTNLLVVAGVNQNIHEMTLAEVRKVTVREGGFTGRIPTMQEYLQRAEQLGIQVLVELKVTGHESKDYLTRFLAQADAAGTATENIYHSLNPRAVKEIKQRRPELRVGLTVAMSMGGLPKTKADFYTLEQASFTPEFLAQAHALDREVHIWTVNDESTIRELLGAGVDGIVTDNVELAIRDRYLVANHPAADYRVGSTLAYLDIFR